MNFLPPRSRRHPAFYQLRWVTAQAPTSKRKPDLPLQVMIHDTFSRDLRGRPETFQSSKMQPVASAPSTGSPIATKLFAGSPSCSGSIRRFVPSLSVEALRVAQGANTYVLKASNASGETAFGQSTGLNHIRVGDVEVPTDAGGGVYLKFRHFDKKSYIPAWKVLAGEVPQEEIEGKIILIGTSAPGLLDLRATPVDEAIPGIDIHAQLLEHLLTGKFLERPDYALALEQFVVLVLGIMLAFALPRVSAKSSAAIGFLTIALVLMGGWVLFKYWRVFIDPSYPALVLGLMTTIITFYTYQSVEAQRSQIRHAFGQYLAPALVEQLAQSPEKLTLGGEDREMTILMSDVRGFTTISESYKDDPQGLTSLMNRLLTPLTNTIVSHEGTIDKYIGDAIMGFWNAPLDVKDHERKACTAALDMLTRLEALNQQRQREAQAGQTIVPFRIGIGINTGRCVVGNIGSDLRFNYSVLGDPVNVAARLEGQTKFYGVPIIIGSRTAERAKELCGPRTRSHYGEGKNRSPNHLRAARPRGHRQQRRLPGIAQAVVDDALLLSQPRLGRRFRGNRVVSIGRAQF